MKRRLRPIRPHALACLLCLAASLLASCGDDTTSLESVRSAHELGEFAATLEPLRARIEAGEVDPEVYYLYGTALIAAQQPELAYFALSEAMKHPDYLEKAGIQLAAAGLLTNDLHETVDATTRILETKPDSVDASSRTQRSPMPGACSSSTRTGSRPTSR